MPQIDRFVFENRMNRGMMRLETSMGDGLGHRQVLNRTVIAPGQRSMTMIGRRFFVGAAILMFVAYGAVESAQALDEVHWRKDRPTRKEPPPGNGWTAGSPTGVTLYQYGTIYIGVENTFLEKEIEKSLTIVIKGEGAEDLRLREGEGYYELPGRTRTSRA